ncbi:hypothetical protein BsWGS_05425 [Bradybaena similaris]
MLSLVISFGSPSSIAFVYDMPTCYCQVCECWESNTLPCSCKHNIQDYPTARRTITRVCIRQFVQINRAFVRPHCPQATAAGPSGTGVSSK